MPYILEGKDGNILIRKSVIRTVVVQCTKEFPKNLWIVNSGGYVSKFAEKIGATTDMNNIEVNFTPLGVDIRLHVVLLFGTSISGVTESLINSIQTRLKDDFSINVNSVAVVVVGMLPVKRTKKKRFIR